MVVPRDVVYEKFRVPNIVKSYSRIPDVVDVPYLVQIQVDSYEVFKNESLRELFDEISPIADFTGNRLEMRFTDYSFGEPKYDQDECRERDATFSAPLKVNVQLLVKETGEVKEQELFMGDFPLMTEKGTFIINGAERVVVAQLVRSPGCYFTLDSDAKVADDELGSDERLLKILAAVDTHPDHHYIQSTIDKEPTKTKQEALL